jgi:hypothetical protein
MRFRILTFWALLTLLQLPLSEASTSSVVVVGRELIGISYDDLCDLFVNDYDNDNDYDNNNNNNNNNDESNDDNNDRGMFSTLRQRRNMIAPLLRKIEEAFGTMSTTNNNCIDDDEDGEDGRGSNRPSLGFLEITDLPSDMVQLRKKLLPKASTLANLSSQELMSLERPDTGYSIGWSHGKESFRNVDNDDDDDARRLYDTAKGSFYMNPFTSTSSSNNDSVPAVVNVYPPSLQPHLEEDLLIMTKFMSRVGLWIAILCDLYLYADQHHQQCAFDDDDDDDDDSNKHENEYPSLSSFDNNEWMVYNSLKLGKTAAKARLLYYFPPGQQKHQQTEEENVEDDPVFDDWCGWHTDHGSLTALLPGLLCDEEEEATGISHNEKDDRLKKQSASSSTSSSYPKPGLYIQTNSNLGKKNDSDKSQQQQQQTELVHVKLSPNSLGFQLGETLQIMSKGKFIATPHAVKAPPSRSMNTKKIGRASLAVFLQPLSNQLLPPLVDIDEKSSSSPSSSLQKEQNDYDDDFSLRRRWRSTFGEFQRVTTEAFN